MARQAQFGTSAQTLPQEPPGEDRRSGRRLRRVPASNFSVRRRLMLIEDDFMLRAHLSELLASEGYLVSCAADGVEALVRLDREPTPSVIVVDIVMPKMNGVSFREVQLQSAVLRSIPTIAVTAVRGVFDLDSLGFEQVLQKPLNFDHLVEALDKLCPTS